MLHAPFDFETIGHGIIGLGALMALGILGYAILATCGLVHPPPNTETSTPTRSGGYTLLNYENLDFYAPTAADFEMDTL